MGKMLAVQTWGPESRCPASMLKKKKLGAVVYVTSELERQRQVNCQRQSINELQFE